jgi:hypothetical protein
VQGLVELAHTAGIAPKAPPALLASGIDFVLEGLYAMKKMIRAVDTVLAFQHKRIYMFSYNDKGMAKEIGERIKAKLTQGDYIAKGTGVEFKTYSFPKDARTQEDFLKGCRVFLKED